MIVDVYSAHTECTIQRRVNTKERTKNDFDKKITTAISFRDINSYENEALFGPVSLLRLSY